MATPGSWYCVGCRRLIAVLINRLPNGGDLTVKCACGYSETFPAWDGNSTGTLTVSARAYAHAINMMPQTRGGQGGGLVKNNWAKEALQHGESEVPEGISPIVACRAWGIQEGRDNLVGPRLRSIGISGFWPRDASVVPLEAVHEGSNFASTTHTCPQPGMNCGFWGFSTPEVLLDEIPAAACVFGVVEMWGRIVPGTFGWRSQYVRLVALMERTKRLGLFRRCSDVATRDMAKEYDVPLLRRWPELTKAREVECESDVKASRSSSSQSTSHYTSPVPGDGTSPNVNLTSIQWVPDPAPSP